LKEIKIEPNSELQDIANLMLKKKKCKKQIKIELLQSSLNNLEKGKCQSLTVNHRGNLVEVTDELLDYVCFALSI
tara:strand:+ start:429 stop:653 length:225 start_codon:yes stop_codon:yes gene_type:complete